MHLIDRQHHGPLVLKIAAIGHPVHQRAQARAGRVQLRTRQIGPHRIFDQIAVGLCVAASTLTAVTTSGSR